MSDEVRSSPISNEGPPSNLADGPISLDVELPLPESTPLPVALPGVGQDAPARSDSEVAAELPTPLRPEALPELAAAEHLMPTLIPDGGADTAALAATLAPAAPEPVLPEPVLPAAVAPPTVPAIALGLGVVLPPAVPPPAVPPPAVLPPPVPRAAASAVALDVLVEPALAPAPLTPPPVSAFTTNAPPPRAPVPAAPSAAFAPELLSPRQLSEPVPLVVTRHAAPARVSSLPPGLVEPKRIIEVLGSNVPVLDSAFEEEAIEDLDESEAFELSETPASDSHGPDSEPELELNMVVDDSLSGELDESSADARAPALVRDVSNGALAEPSSAEVSQPGVPASDGPGSESPNSEADSDDLLSPAGRRVKAPPNKRRRPPPPSARASEKAKVEAALGTRKWWEEMFSEEFLRAIPILSPRQLEREVNFIDEGLGVARGGRILDLACGAGQHAVELAARGYDLVGFDLSQSQLDWAGGLAQERGQRLQFTYGDMRELTYQESFDAVYCWNTSFGFFEEDKNFDVAQRVFKALRPGGRFLLDVVNRDFVVSQQPGQTWFEGDGCVCIDDVSIDFITSRMRVKRTLMLTNGRNRECNYSLRIYGLHELGKILHDVGFKILKVSGRPEMPGVFFGSASPRIIILAAKP
jgi:SAM-dependent methyltransferase